MGRRLKQTFSPKKTYKWPINTWKDAQYYSLLKEWKSKLQWQMQIKTTMLYHPHQSEWWCSVALLCLTLYIPINCIRPGFPVLHYLPEFAQNHVLWISEAIQPSHPLLPPSPLAFSLSWHQGLFQWVGSSYQVARALELQVKHCSFQWIFRVDFL